MSSVETKVRQLADSLSSEEWDLLWSLSATHNHDGVPPELQAKLQTSVDTLSTDERDEVRRLGERTGDVTVDVEGYMIDADDRASAGLRVLSGILTRYF